MKECQSSRFCLIGYPLGHSMSPFIHAELFRASGRAGEYSLIEIPPEQLGDRLPELLKTMAGFNITIPHKKAAIPLLDKIDPNAANYGAVNVVKCGEENVGYNTDSVGFLRSLSASGIALSGRVAVLGCGGVAGMMGFEAAKNGCDTVFAVREADREMAADVVEDIRRRLPSAKVSFLGLGELCGKLDLLINGTPVGMYPHAGECAVDRSVVADSAAVFDAIYNPAETLLLQYAAECGVPAVGGMSMLVWQAAAAHEIWYGARFDNADIERITEAAKREMEEKFN